MEQTNCTSAVRQPWNKGKLVGQKTPLKLREIWAIRIRLQLADRRRELALFNLAIDSKLRGCDLVKLRVRDVCHGQAIASRLGRECRRARRRELGEQRFQCAHQQRRHPNIAAVALANKNVRAVWAMLAHGREFQADYMPTRMAA